jgi:hypothetical protein
MNKYTFAVIEAIDEYNPSPIKVAFFENIAIAEAVASDPMFKAKHGARLTIRRAAVKELGIRKVYSSYTEYVRINSKQAKLAALSKLTDDDKAALGLI